ncbi:hypothetical protein DRE_03966 [Drechslerella stenobrocha 248]|uniref:Helix-turn-helix domain-containing protein n=1 Tax=Drechslerella stenobrocha 248 TaxID=1043628 RepID=W7HRP7_9PEZI|nr:hypothetical protein DRE_03966 [Drechslerella stenobrocha 248]
MGAAASTRRLPTGAKRVQQLQQSTRAPPLRTPPPKTWVPANRPEDVSKDAQDPHFSSMLRSLGSVAHDNTPPQYPSSSSSSPLSSYPASSLPPRTPHTAHASAPTPQRGFTPRIPDSVRILHAREAISEDIQLRPEEYLDIFRVRDVVMLRNETSPRVRDDEIERRLRLKKGVLARLGRRIGHTGVQVPSGLSEREFEEREEIIGEGPPVELAR